LVYKPPDPPLPRKRNNICWKFGRSCMRGYLGQWKIWRAQTQIRGFLARGNDCLCSGVMNEWT
jgi:hypothetical protein